MSHFSIAEDMYYQFFYHSLFPSNAFLQMQYWKYVTEQAKTIPCVIKHF